MPPPVRSKNGARQTNPKVLAVAGGVVLLIGLVVGLAIALSGGKSTSYHGPTVGAVADGLPGAGDVQKMLDGILQHGNTLGRPDAPVTLAEYVDFQCPYCRDFETSVAPTVIQRFVRTGRLRVELRPIAFIGPDSETGRDAALAAGLQNKLFNFAELLYMNQATENTGWLTRDMTAQIAEGVPGLNVPQMLQAARSQQVLGQAHGFDTAAGRDKVQSTPTLLVGPTGGTLRPVNLQSNEDFKTLAAAINAVK